jgi:hypothetical protein
MSTNVRSFGNALMPRGVNIIAHCTMCITTVILRNASIGAIVDINRGMDVSDYWPMLTRCVTCMKKFDQGSMPTNESMSPDVEKRSIENVKKITTIIMQADQTPEWVVPEDPIDMTINGIMRRMKDNTQISYVMTWWKSDVVTDACVMSFMKPGFFW